MMGVTYICKGEKACGQGRQAIGALRHFWPDKVSIAVITDIRDAWNDMDVTVVHSEEDHFRGRVEKTSLATLSPWDITLYMDADTRLLQAGSMCDRLHAFAASGYEMVVALSNNQDREAFWHVSDSERDHTLTCMGYTPVQWQAGVVMFRKTRRVLNFFERWQHEWSIFRGEDQAAFVRALHMSPVLLWPLSRDFNGGAQVSHRFGDLR